LDKLDILRSDCRCGNEVHSNRPEINASARFYFCRRASKRSPAKVLKTIRKKIYLNLGKQKLFVYLRPDFAKALRPEPNSGKYCHPWKEHFSHRKENAGTSTGSVSVWHLPMAERFWPEGEQKDVKG